MDILHFLKSHHDAIRTSCAELAAPVEEGQRRIKIEALVAAVQGYMNLEKDYLYPEIAGLFAGAESLVASGAAHAAVIDKRLKALIKLLPKGSGEVADATLQLQQLQEVLLRHFEQEEQILMPKMRSSIRTEDREDLGQVFVDVEAEVLADVLSAAKIDGHNRRRSAVRVEQVLDQ